MSIALIDGDKFYDDQGQELCPACLDPLPCTCLCSEGVKESARALRAALSGQLKMLDEILTDYHRPSWPRRMLSKIAHRLKKVWECSPL